MAVSSDLLNRLCVVLASQGAAQELLSILNLIGSVQAGPIRIAGTLTITGGVVDSSVGTVAAAGSTNADGGVLAFYHNDVTGADGTKGVVLPSVAVVGQCVEVVNTDPSSALNVYADPSGTGGTVNGGSANAAASLAAGKGAVYRCVSITGANQWWSLSN